jgi:hypothetical protein
VSWLAPGKTRLRWLHIKMPGRLGGCASASEVRLAHDDRLLHAGHPSLVRACLA